MKKLQLYPGSLSNQCNDVALCWQDKSLTYKEYFQAINRYILLLRSQGISQDSRVAVCTDINDRFPILFFALLQIKAIVIPLDHRLPAARITDLLKQIDCEFFISLCPSSAPVVSGDLKILTVGEGDAFQDLPEMEENISFSLDQNATILFTSGTSGGSKAVVHTIGNHYYSARGSNTNICFDPGDRWLITLPFHHVAGIAILFRALLTGGTAVISSTGQALDAQIASHRVTHLSVVPTQLYRLINDRHEQKNLSTLKAVLVGGSYCPENLIYQALSEKIPLLLSYGSTEMSSQITTTRPGDDLTKTVHSGYLLPFREMMIEKDLEILVKGRTLARGYWQNGRLNRIVDRDGWFHTGDLGQIDGEGRLTVAGRKDTMFISGGENIYPEEIEKILRQADDIVNACVVPVKDDEYGERPVAFIEMRGNAGIDEKAIRAFLKDRISGIKIPVRYFQWQQGNSLKSERRYFQKLAEDFMQPQGLE